MVDMARKPKQVFGEGNNVPETAVHGFNHDPEVLRRVRQAQYLAPLIHLDVGRLVQSERVLENGRLGCEHALVHAKCDGLSNDHDISVSEPESLLVHESIECSLIILSGTFYAAIDARRRSHVERRLNLTDVCLRLQRASVVRHSDYVPASVIHDKTDLGIQPPSNIDALRTIMERVR